MSIFILATASALVCAACGQKGPLVLPPPPAAPQSKAPDTRPADRPFPDVPATTETK